MGGVPGNIRVKTLHRTVWESDNKVGSRTACIGDNHGVYSTCSACTISHTPHLFFADVCSDPFNALCDTLCKRYDKKSGLCEPK